jgi:hypothetical protein
MPTKILVSYRRSDSASITGRIFDRLVSRYGKDSVFMDVDNIPLGVDFREHIREALLSSDLLIVVIGQRWLGGDGETARINDETDPVRVEVEAALKNSIPIVPVLVEGGKMPRASDLPVSLREFSYRNAAEIDSGRDFHAHVNHLIGSIDEILKAKSAVPFKPAPELAPGTSSVPLVGPAAKTDDAKAKPAPRPNAPVGEGSAIASQPGGGEAPLTPALARANGGVLWGLPVHTQNFLGGIIIAVTAMVLVLFTFYVSSPTVPRIMAILTALVGVGIAAGLIPVRSPRDVYGGLALLELATFALIASAELPGQRGFAFGPGTAPRLFAGLLAGLGVAVSAIGLATDGPRIEQYRMRGPALVISAIILFAALIRPFGLVLATYLAFVISILGSREMRWIESLIAAAAMTAFCVGLFVYLLNLPFQLTPQPNAFAILGNQFLDIFRVVLGLIQKLPKVL